MKKRLYTDYPVARLGDKPNVEAPIREIQKIKEFFGIWALCVVDGVEQEIKLGYIYDEPRRFDVEKPQAISQSETEKWL